MRERRSPYLVLGVDYGTDAAAAAAAFARVSKRVKRDPNPPYSMEDITSALHSLEQAESNPDASVDTFRVPANPSVYPDAGLDDLLPVTPPMARTTPTGCGRHAVETEAVVADLHRRLGTVAADMLASPPPPHDPVADAAPPKASAHTVDHSGAIAFVLILIIAIALIAIAANNESDDGPLSDTTATMPWVERGDCLRDASSTAMEQTPCGAHDAVIFAVRRDADSGQGCPSEVDVWFDDAWGVYCALIVTDETSEGGHWGIGPIHNDSCVEIDSRGRLVGKSRCDSRALPVLTTARTTEGCDVPYGRGDGYYYFGASDGTSNYVCIDSADWDAAGLPSG